MANLKAWWQSYIEQSESTGFAANEEPLRGELLSVDLLRHFARNLAQKRQADTGRGTNLLLPRLTANEKILHNYNVQTLRLEKTHRITPAAEWLLDNFHLIETQIRTAQRHLPRRFNRELPQLLNGPWRKFPRAYEIAAEMVAHTDGRIDAAHLTGFLTGYQEMVPLKLGELWAIPIMLRLALIENLRRVAAMLSHARDDHDAAESWANRILETAEKKTSDLIITVGEMARAQTSLSRAFVTEFLRRIQEKPTPLKLAMSWIEERLAEDGATVDQLMQAESQYQATMQVSVGNCISSLRFLDTMDWRDFVEEHSVVEQLMRTDPAQVYAKMDFSTRDLYRHSVERIARHSKRSELEVATVAIGLAQKHIAHADDRLAHVGFFLTGKGVRTLEQATGMRVSAESLPGRIGRRFPLTLYLGGIAALSLLVAVPIGRGVAATGAPGWQVGIMALLALICASQLGVSLVNWIATIVVKPSVLPKLDFSKGIPPPYATMVVVPTMLTGTSGIENLLEALEVRYLANGDKNVYFTLLTDFADSPTEFKADDEELVRQASHGIRRLNEKYQSDRPNIFHLLHRPRRWNEGEKTWMGYERKRGKLADLNACLRGGSPACFSHTVGDLAKLPCIQYVITLDTDTQLPRDAARQLAATMAHPLNRPIYDAEKGLVVEGYTILQPRVAVSLPSAQRSRFVKLFSGDPGIDPYTQTVSDVYQDVFHEGSFTGKGIYDIDAFERTLKGKFPENRILSHDLLEGSYARAGLVSDVQLFEEYPSRFHADARRRHRWMRGDWQIATWLMPRLPGMDVSRVQNPLSGLSRWKIFDNLRRSLVPFALILLLLLGVVLFPGKASAWGLLILAIIALPAFLAVFTELLQKPPVLPLRLHFNAVGKTVARQLAQICFTLAFLPYDAVISMDAIVRTLCRLLFTKRNLLEWQTASDVDRQNDGGLRSYFLAMGSASLLALGVMLLFLFSRNPPAPVIYGFVASWILSPVMAWWLSLPLREKRAELQPGQIRHLRQLARKTWNFFETFVTAEDNWLPPDNFQEYPLPVLATRTSPTNVGFALLSALAAYDFGYLSRSKLVERVSRTMDSSEKVERYNGHFYNWYDTRTLKPMAPPYISTVDNGNLAALLLTLHTGLLELADEIWNSARVADGLKDTLDVLKEQNPNEATTPRLHAIGIILAEFPISPADTVTALDKLSAMAAELSGQEGSPGDPFEKWRRLFEQTCRDQRDEIAVQFPWVRLHGPLQVHLKRETAHELGKLWEQLNSPPSLSLVAGEFKNWQTTISGLIARAQLKAECEESIKLLSDLSAALEQAGKNAVTRVQELQELAQRCDDMARMDFTLLYDPARELFSVGYNVSQHRLDASYYDLLASESRLGSFVAIALGQVEQNHWFRLGRSLTSTSGTPTLISWSGSMFEYLMPMLIMPSYENTLLDYSCKSMVARQIEYGKQMKVPWGISESGYNMRDAAANYQYQAFGVPGLGFKRGLAQDLVIAPYATVMALMVAPEEACNNLTVLVKDNAEDKFGVYEALDYTPERVPTGQKYVIVRSFMAHHQGMGFLSLTYLLLNRPMQRRFQANPLFKAADLLLHERVPKETSVLFPHELEANRERETAVQAEATLRVFTDPNAGPPEVHLLSNGRYHVMVTNSGGGYSRWNETLLTRWREDTTRDCWGTFIYLRDVGSGSFWSTAHQPTLENKPGYEAIFSQGRAEFRSRRNEIEAYTEIAVSPENDVEVRRLTLTNHSDEIRVVEITSYAEIVLNSAAADLAHPAFSNLFIQTQIVPRQNAIICSRRPRAAHEKPPLTGHLLLLQGGEVDTVSFETDRSKFIGRDGTLASPSAMKNFPASNGKLSNSEGSVLDPIAAIRRTVRLQPKESAIATLVCGVASTREEITSLIEKYQDQSIANRCFELAWTHGLVALRQLNTTEAEAQLYGRLAGALLFHQTARRAKPDTLIRNQRGQRNLWSFGISGDLPIVLLHSRRADRGDLIRQVVQAHAYWRLKGLAADLVILNDDNSTYRQPLNDQIRNFIAAGNATQLMDKPGGIFLRQADQLPQEDKILLETVARIVLNDDQGTLMEQWQQRGRIEVLPPPLRPRARATTEPAVKLPERDLIFSNGLGGFTPDGREYIITLRTGETTPLPWVNVLANPNFGTLISESGSAYTWSENSHEFRLTPWSNDAVTDTGGEAFYVREESTGQFWSPTPLPARGETPYVARHGFGYSVFEHSEAGIFSELSVFVAANDPVKFALLKLRNDSKRRRRLSITGYWQWVLGELCHTNAMHVATEIDPQSNALLARNPYNTDFEGRVAFVNTSEAARSATANRAEFLGRNGTHAQPAALYRARLSGRTGAGLDPCAALQVPVELEPGEEREISFIIGTGKNREQARDLIQRFQPVSAAREELIKVRAFWKHALEAVRVETPEPTLDVLVNGWLLYQTIGCRLWARTGFYQSGGAFGFRDQLQDAMSLVHTHRELLREQLLRAAAHQFREGDAQHWWHPPVGRGVRTHFSDDYLWLPYATCRYVSAVGDTGVLDSEIPFLESRALRPDEESNYDLPQRSTESGTLYEHCVRAIKNGLKFGEHGLPLMGCGDWNDGMNLVGQHGKGESVWLAFFLYDVLKRFAVLAERRGEQLFARQCDEQAKTLLGNIEKYAWDGGWYRRAYFDNGEPLGSAINPECQIDSLPQSWAVIAGGGDPERARMALEAVAHRLVRRDDQLIQLFTPPFDTSALEPGYIKGYVPGVRENGGQYTHAAIWTVMAFALAGETQRAWEFLRLINPILHTQSVEQVARYKVEPYVMAADVYSVPPHKGRGGWTWYTGSAGWMYRLLTETLLGIEVVVDELRFTPRVPAEWKSFKIAYRFRETTYRISFQNLSGNWQATPKILLDGRELPQSPLKLADDHQEHTVQVTF